MESLISNSKKLMYYNLWVNMKKAKCFKKLRLKNKKNKNIDIDLMIFMDEMYVRLGKIFKVISCDRNENFKHMLHISNVLNYYKCSFSMNLWGDKSWGHFMGCHIAFEQNTKTLTWENLTQRKLFIGIMIAYIFVSQNPS